MGVIAAVRFVRHVRTLDHVNLDIDGGREREDRDAGPWGINTMRRGLLSASERYMPTRISDYVENTLGSPESVQDITNNSESDYDRHISGGFSTRLGQGVVPALDLRSRNTARRGSTSASGPDAAVATGLYLSPRLAQQTPRLNNDLPLATSP